MRVFYVHRTEIEFRAIFERQDPAPTLRLDADLRTGSGRSDVLVDAAEPPIVGPERKIPAATGCSLVKPLVIQYKSADGPAGLVRHGFRAEFLERRFPFLDIIGSRRHELTETLAAIESRDPLIAPAFLLDLGHEISHWGVESDKILGFARHLRQILIAPVNRATVRGCSPER